MPILRPYRRTCRQFVDGSYAAGGRWGYILHPKYALAPEHYVRAFLILQKDLRELFDYVEPSDNNLGCYSYRIHSLLVRACVEVEANCKAILTENGYRKSDDWKMNDYRKIEKTHLLSAYEVKVPTWTGSQSIRKPFVSWANGNGLPWYKAYNTTKHDRHSQFEQARLEHALDACCGLLALLSAQFETNDFGPGSALMAMEDTSGDGMESAIGGYFRVRFPIDFPQDLRYDFDWQKLKSEADPFQIFDYNSLS